MNKLSKMLTLMLAIAATMFSCVEDDYDKPDIQEIPVGEVYTIAQVKDFYNNNGGDYTFLEDASVYGTVTMDEETDNSYKTPFIQDHTGGIAVFLNTSGGLYIGDSVRVYLKDLKIMQYSDLFQINDVTGSNGVDVDDNVIKQGYSNPLVPEEATIAEIIANDDSKAYYQGRLVKITNVQFLETDTAGTLAYPDTQESENRKLQDANDKQLIVRTSGYASFAGNSVPDGSGSIVGIISQFGDDMQLIIRRMREVEMNNERFEVTGGGSGNAPTPNTTIDELKALFTGGSYDFQQINGNVVIEGTVVANDQNGNYYKAIVIQDETSGITLKINDYDLFENFQVGRKVVIDCNGLYVGAYADLIQLGATYDDNGTEKFGGIQPGVLDNYVYRLDDITPLTPTIVTIPEITDNHLGMLIQIDDVQFADAYIGNDYLGGGDANYNIDLEDCSGNTIIVRTSSYADYASDIIETGKGTFIGVLAKYFDDYQLYIRDIDELDMTGPRCSK